MLMLFTEWLMNHISAFRVFQYISVRFLMSTATGFALSLLLGPIVIRRLLQMRITEVVRLVTPENHRAKEGTPTMGGLMILLCFILATYLWVDPTNFFVALVVITAVLFAAIGFLDDYFKLTQGQAAGFKIRTKLLLQAVAGLAIGIALYNYDSNISFNSLSVPFFKDLTIYLGIFFTVMVAVVIMASSNAVNISDGLDGLAIFPSVMVAAGLGVIAYLVGHVRFADYLAIQYVPHAGELTVCAGALIGSGLGFLWFNCHPAQIFMGDVGSLFIGAVLGLIAVMIKHELVFLIMAGFFVMEALSVIIQIISFRLYGKRVFNKAPIHHHFEMKGWTESQIIVRFWIISAMFVLLALATLKLR